MPERSTVLVTGATDGIGRETARVLANDGWHVLVHGRDEAKATNAASSIAANSRSTSPVWGNFERMSEVVQLAAQVTKCVTRLDALINNAGIYADRCELNEDGIELTMGVNHFAPFLLTHHLMPLLGSALAARIVNVSSMTHSGASLNFNDLGHTRAWNSYDAYASSKLANILFTRQLTSNLSNRRITANTLHPGVIGTKLLRSGFGTGGGSVEDGARTSIYLTTSADVAKTSGRYFVNCREEKPSTKALDARLAAKLWDVSTTLLADYI